MPARRNRYLAGTLLAVGLLGACTTTPDPFAGESLPAAVPTSSGDVVFETAPPLELEEVPAQGTRPPAPEIPADTPTSKVLQVAYDSGMRNGWVDVGWDPRRITSGGPARIDLGNGGGWLIEGKPPKATTAIEFRFRSEQDLGPVVRFIVGGGNAQNLGREMRLTVNKPDADGWIDVRIPMWQIVPSGSPFDALRFAPTKRLRSPALIEIDKLQFTSGGSMSGYGTTRDDPAVRPATTRPKVTKRPPPVDVVGLKRAPEIETDKTFVADCAVDNKPISQLIYGVGFAGADNQREDPYAVFPGANRWGGNPTSRFNYLDGNAWNTANDYFFRNVRFNANAENSMTAFLSSNEANRVPSAVTVPTLGWIARDRKSYGFPVSEYGPQQQTDPEIPDAGNGRDQSGQPIFPGSPRRTSIESTPKMISKWVAEQLRGRTTMYFLDNEPELWDSTHRDVHPTPLTYEELLQNTIDYATAIRKSDPKAIIAGPSSWGWTGYFWSGADAAAGFDKAPDRKAHGDLPLLPWYLKSLRAYEEKNKVKMLDLLDVHFYPQGEGMYTSGVKDRVDPEGAALRLRMTRGLWDPGYKDESWINEPIALIPRLRKWIDTFSPGLGISIGEWNFGGENHMSGGLAVAEVLGRFGTEGVTSAYYWTAPPKNSPAFWGFRAYRNFDGKGGTFQSTSIRINGAEAYPTISAFASKSEDGGEMTIVLLNTSPTESSGVQVQFSGCFRLRSHQLFQYTGNPSGFEAGPEYGVARDMVSVKLPPYSISVVRAKFS